MSDEYYKLLNVDKNASISEIKASYKKLALKYHPDKCKPEEREANEAEFKKIKTAYETLSDENKRRQYDLGGGGGVGGSGIDGMNFQNFFNIFDNMNPMNNMNEQMYNITVNVPVSMVEVYTGSIKTVKYNKNIKCETCNCKGYINPEDVNRCNMCNGQGFVEQIVQMGFLRQIIKNHCNSCRGKGTIVITPCTTCNGNKIISTEASVNLKFPKGIKNNDSINLKQKGNYYPNTNYTTDLIIIANIQPHPDFTREDNNLVTTMTISLAEALKGFKKIIKFLDDTDLEIVSTSILNPNSTIIIPDKGIKTGSLIVKFNIEFPTNLDDFKTQLLD